MNRQEYNPFGAEWELEMLKFKKQELVEILRSALEKKQNKKPELTLEEWIEILDNNDLGDVLTDDTYDENYAVSISLLIREVRYIAKIIERNQNDKR